MNLDAPDKLRDRELPLYPIGVVAELLGVADQTLRLYESHGLIKPARRNRERYYSQKDIEWIKCLRQLIHDKGINIEGIKRLLSLAPCWEIRECGKDELSKCMTYRKESNPCWEIVKKVCIKKHNVCKDCIVYQTAISK